MVNSITPPPISGKVGKYSVSSNEPHHEVNKDKKDRGNNKKNNPEDKVELSTENEEKKEHKGKKYPDLPTQGNIKIDV